jgi:starch phosphorylase
MKAVANGVLNVSILDGWWAEAWDLREGEPFGWAIGNGEEYGDTAYQDQVEAEALYDLLEREIVPAFYDRGGNTLPRKWIARMKSSIAALCPVFNTHRMVQDYTRQFYLVADANMRRLTAEGALGARELAAWTARVTRHWGSIHIQSVTVEPRGELRSGEQLRARALVRLGELSPSDVLVEAYIGLVSPAGDLQNGIAVALNHAGADTSGLHVFEGPLAPAARAGLHGITVRAMPYHSDGASPFLPGLIAWADARSAGIPAAAP